MSGLTDRVDELGEYLREQRIGARLSVRELAKTAGVSNPYLSQIERGLRRPSAEVLQQLANGLRISAEALYVRAGILDAEARPQVEAAISADPQLSDRQRRALLDIYASFIAENARAAGEDPVATLVGSAPVRVAHRAAASSAAARRAVADKAVATKQTASARTTAVKKAASGTAKKAARGSVATKVATKAAAGEAVAQNPLTHNPLARKAIAKTAARKVSKRAATESSVNAEPGALTQSDVVRAGSKRTVAKAAKKAAQQSSTTSVRAAAQDAATAPVTSTTGRRQSRRPSRKSGSEIQSPPN